MSGNNGITLEKTRTPDIGCLIDIIRALVGEVHPKWKNLRFTPDTQLERELGLDSMARTELRIRINDALGIKLDEKTAICAATPNDLMQAILLQVGDGVPKHAPAQRMDTGKNASGDLLMGAFGKAMDEQAARPAGHTLSEWLYAIYVWPVFLTLGIVSWILVVFTPFSNGRSWFARHTARLFFWLTITPLRVAGRENIDPDIPQIVVANHTSYLDGFIITAALDIPIHFVVKGELSRILPVRLILQRFGVEFVDRFNAHRGASAVRRIAEKSQRGHTQVFFPEGTFARFEGLQPFRMGAFVTATRTGVPVVPVAIRGARNIVRGNDRFPLRGSIDVTIRPPILPDDKEWSDALALRDAARREISDWCGEPDLVEAEDREVIDVPGD